MRICERVTPCAVSSRTRRPPAQVQDQYETELSPSLQWLYVLIYDLFSRDLITQRRLLHLCVLSIIAGNTFNNWQSDGTCNVGTSALHLPRV